MFGRGLGDTYAVFLLPLERDLGWSRSALTSVYSVYLLVNGCTAPFVGLLFDRLGPRWVYGVGVTCLGAAMLLASGLAQLWQFYLFIGVLVGIGVSLNGMVPASALLARWYRERLSTAIGIAYAAFGAGTVLFVPLVQFLVGEHGWRTTYHILGWMLLALAPVVILCLPWKKFAAGGERLHQAQKAGEGWTLAAALRSPVFWGLVQVFFCTAAGVFSIVVQLIAFFVDAGFSPLAAASAFGVVGLLSAMSVMGSGIAAERFGYRQTITASFAGTLSGLLVLLAMTAAPSWFLLVLFVPLYGFCMGVRGPIVSSVAARYFAGPRVATIYGVIYASNAVGAALGSLAGGLLHDLTGGYRAALTMALVLMTLAALPFWTVPTLRNYR
jgi:MFS family permease